MSSSSTPSPSSGAPTPEPGTDPSQVPDPGSEPLDVLVVEDDPVALEYVRQMLESRGHRVTTASDAETGLEHFQELRPPLVLLDRTLPEMDGTDLCRRIRALPDTDDVVILFVTGAEAHEALDEALRAGANDYVVKPVSPRLLHVRLAIAERRIEERRAHRARERELRRQALRDDVTDLWNREMLREQAEKAVERARRSDGRFAVALVDLDGFHGINERHGSEAADDVLREVGRRIQRSIRDVDVASRIAADEFGVLLEDLTGEIGPTRVAGRIQEALTEPIRTGGREIYVSACVGIAQSSEEYDHVEDVLRDAGKALNRAKERGRGEVQIYDPEVHARAMARVDLEDQIREALEKKSLSLHYQPILDLKSGGIRSVEALLRWTRDDGAPTLPPDFIPVAEETGLIVPLGWWTLETACRQLRVWTDEVPGADGIDMSVNVSARQLDQPEIDEMVARALERNGVPPQRLHLEVTETSVMGDVTSAHETLTRLKELGVHLHIDDFGTGYSSLSHLSRLPFDTVKIDREFIWQMDEGPADLEVVRTIVRLARALRMEIVAEGVETESQEARLRELECDFVQGYRYHRPMDPGGVHSLLSDRGPA